MEIKKKFRDNENNEIEIKIVVSDYNSTHCLNNLCPRGSTCGECYLTSIIEKCKRAEDGKLMRTDRCIKIFR